MADNCKGTAKADRYLEKWNKYQQEKKINKRKPLTAVETQSLLNSNTKTKSESKSKLGIGTGNAKVGQNAGKVKSKGSVVASKYMSVHTQKPSSSVKNAEKTKPTKVENTKRTTITGNKSNTPMSVKLQRWKDKKKEEQENKQFKNEAVIHRRQTIAVSQMKSDVNTIGKSESVPATYDKNNTKFTTQKPQASGEDKRNNDQLHKPLQRKSIGTFGSTKSLAHNKLGNSAGVKPNLTQKIINGGKATNKRQENIGSVDPKKNNTKTATVSKYKTKMNNFKESPVKMSLQRRHSVVEGRVNEHGKKTTVGILKRKSCIPSFSDDSGSPIKQVRQGHDGENEDNGGNTDCIHAHCIQTPGRSVRFVSPDIVDKLSSSQYRKTPNKPKLDLSMRNKLDDWLKSKGKTPSKFRHLMCFDAHMSAKRNQDPHAKRSLSVQELTEQQEAMENEHNVVMNLAARFDEDPEETMNSVTDDPVYDQLDTMLEECTILFEAGCPLEDITRWLDSIEKNVSASKSSANFYICKAQILQSTGDLDKILDVFETAVRNFAQPASKLASALSNIIKDVTLERERKARRRSALEKQIEAGNVFESSAIKYCVKQVTPFKKRKSSGDAASVSSQCAVVTPVRRSTRRSVSNLPSTFHDKTPVYKTLEEMTDEDKKRTLYQPNTALELLLSDEEDFNN